MTAWLFEPAAEQHAHAQCAFPAAKCDAHLKARQFADGFNARRLIPIACPVAQEVGFDRLAGSAPPGGGSLFAVERKLDVELLASRIGDTAPI